MSGFDVPDGVGLGGFAYFYNLTVQLEGADTVTVVRGNVEGAASAPLDVPRLIDGAVVAGGGGNLEEIDVLQAFDPDNHSNARVLTVRIPGLGGHLGEVQPSVLAPHGGDVAYHVENHLAILVGSGIDLDVVTGAGFPDNGNHVTLLEGFSAGSLYQLRGRNPLLGDHDSLNLLAFLNLLGVLPLNLLAFDPESLPCRDDFVTLQAPGHVIRTVETSPLSISGALESLVKIRCGASLTGINRLLLGDLHANAPTLLQPLVHVHAPGGRVGILHAQLQGEGQRPAGDHQGCDESVLSHVCSFFIKIGWCRSGMPILFSFWLFVFPIYSIVSFAFYTFIGIYIYTVFRMTL